MRRIPALLAVVALALAAAGAALGAPGDRPLGDVPPPASPDDAAALAAAPAQAIPAKVRRVSIAEAMAAGRQPGAESEGLAPANIGVFGNTAHSRTAAYYCWYVTLGSQWGTWPYQQKVYDHTYWCGYYPGGSLTYRSTNVTHDTTLCDGSGDYSFRVEGGVPNYYVAIEAGAYFSCPTTIPWITIHRHDWQHDFFDTYGRTYTYEWS